MNVLGAMMILLPLVWPLLLSGLFLHIVPDLWRPDVFFAVTVDPGFRDSQLACGIRRRYRVAIWTATLIAVVLAVVAAFAAHGDLPALAALAALVRREALGAMPLVPPVVLLPSAVGLWAFVRANRSTRPHAAQRPSVVKVELSGRPETRWPMIAALAAPIASLAVVAGWSLLHWHDLPSRLAVHWSIPRPDRWVSTTPAHVALLLCLHALIGLLLAILAWGVLYGSRRVATSGEAAERERRFRARVVSLVVTAEYFSVFPAWAALLDISPKVMEVWTVGFPATILVLFFRIVLTGQGGSRGLERTHGGVVGDRTDDHYWAWGLIYFNRADPAFLIEKRFGVGYTFNFGHPFAWALIGLVVAIPLVSRLL
jgi:uncharacterized membrane protein